jgi:hypothetical protein
VTPLRCAVRFVMLGSLCSVLSARAMTSRRLVRGFLGDQGAPLEAT